MSDWDSLISLMASFRMDISSFQVVFNEHSHICGVVWKVKEKKKPELKLYKAGADATRA